MDVNVITTLISSVGFPIFVSLVLFYYIYKMQEKTNETIKSLTEAVNNNTNVVNNLIIHMNEIRNDVINEVSKTIVEVVSDGKEE